MNRCAVLGSPVAHSLSPAMHRAAYTALELDGWTYEAIEVDEDDFAAFVGSLDSAWRGLSVTAPLKRQAARFATRHDPAVDLTGAANTLVFEAGGCHAYNTDLPGAVAALRERGVEQLGGAVILGAGATAHSVGEAAIELGAERLAFMARRPEAARELATAFAGRAETSVVRFDEVLPASDLLVSTVPSSAVPAPVLDAVALGPAVFDVVYDPWPTALAATAERHGVPVASGLDLLAHQAAIQVRLMTGATVEAAMLRDAALGELGSRG